MSQSTAKKIPESRVLKLSLVKRLRKFGGRRECGETGCHNRVLEVRVVETDHGPRSLSFCRRCGSYSN